MLKMVNQKNKDQIEKLIFDFISKKVFLNSKAQIILLINNLMRK